MEDRRSDSLALTVSSRSDLAERRADIRNWVNRHAEGQTADDVVLACGEAIDNALEHGTPPITVKHRLRRPTSVLTIVVRDTGNWRVSAAVPPRGLGLPIMMALDGQRHGRHDGRHGHSAVPSPVDGREGSIMERQVESTTRATTDRDRRDDSASAGAVRHRRSGAGQR